jgi:hypothetical protein
MTRDEARAGLLVHMVHTVEDYIRARDKGLATEVGAHYEMGVGWADAETLWSDFVEFQRKELERLKR